MSSDCIKLFAAGGPEEQCTTGSLVLVQPRKRDRVKVLRSEDGSGLGATGTMIGIDQRDGILKLDGAGTMKITDIAYLGRLI